MGNYWLYLEPYTFVFHNEEKFIIYNTINGAYLSYPLSSSIMKHIIKELDKAENGYGVSLTNEEIESISSFVNKIKGTFSGDIIHLKDKTSLPFIFKPVCCIMEKKMENDNMMEQNIVNGFGFEVLSNLNEIILFIGANNTTETFNKYPYYKQFMHSMNCNKSTHLTECEYSQLVSTLKYTKIGKLNIIINNINTYPLMYKLYSILSECSINTHIYWNYEDVYTNIFNLFSKFPNCIHFINVHCASNTNLIQQKINEFKKMNIIWNMIVNSEEDLSIVQKLEGSINIIPYYNGSNKVFFEKYVYNDLESILEDPIDKQTIFRRQTLNENFFGKLFILPNGEVHANMNSASLGNIKEMSLAEIVYKEMNQSTAWFKQRDKDKCENCVNKYLCPSISDYELVMQKYDLCNIEP